MAREGEEEDGAEERVLAPQPPDRGFRGVSAAQEGDPFSFRSSSFTFCFACARSLTPIFA
jgi:hypothetical protein